MLEFFKSLVSAGIPGLSSNDLLTLLVNPVMSAKGGMIHKQGHASIAKCVASLVDSNEKVNIPRIVTKAPFGRPGYSFLPYSRTLLVLSRSSW